MAEQLRKRKITSPEQATTALIQEINETQSPIEKDEDDDDDDDDDDNDDNDEDKTDNPWRYHKNNKGAVFTITAHVQDHILTKIQGIKSAKLIWIKLQKLYGTTTDLEEFMLLDKLFSISYESATSMSANWMTRSRPWIALAQSSTRRSRNLSCSTDLEAFSPSFRRVSGKLD